MKKAWMTLEATTVKVVIGVMKETQLRIPIQPQPTQAISMDQSRMILVENAQLENSAVLLSFISKNALMVSALMRLD